MQILGIAAALAAPITVNNPSFEIVPPGGFPLTANCVPTTGCSYNEGSIPDWTGSGTFGEFIPGTQVGNFFAFNTIPDGTTVAYSNSGTISQTVGATVQAGVVYTLQVDLGWRNDLPTFIGTADLLVNGTQYFATGAIPVQGNWSDFTATYTGLAADVGDPITIELNSSGTQADFDEVRLADNLAFKLPLRSSRFRAALSPLAGLAILSAAASAANAIDPRGPARQIRLPPRQA